MSPLARLGPLLLASLALVAGCTSATEKSAPTVSSTATPSTAANDQPVAPTAPAVGSCHRLTLDQATAPVGSGETVPCPEQHTAVTIKVGALAPVVDGHLLAIDSRIVRTQIEKSCPTTPSAYLGGDATAVRLSRFEVVSFSPSLEQADAGANWYRCDLVAVRSEEELLPLPGRLKGILARPDGLDRFGTCGTTAPDARSFARVVCAQPHAWRAVDVIDLPRSTRYLAKPAAARGNAACKDVAADRADGKLKYTWSFEWPTRAQWASGQRYGFCWVPQR